MTALGDGSVWAGVGSVAGFPLAPADWVDEQLRAGRGGGYRSFVSAGCLRTGPFVLGPAPPYGSLAIVGAHALARFDSPWFCSFSVRFQFAFGSFSVRFQFVFSSLRFLFGSFPVRLGLHQRTLFDLLGPIIDPIGYQIELETYVAKAMRGPANLYITMAGYLGSAALFFHFMVDPHDALKVMPASASPAPASLPAELACACVCCVVERSPFARLDSPPPPSAAIRRSRLQLAPSRKPLARPRFYPCGCRQQGYHPLVALSRGMGRLIEGAVG